MFNVYTQLRYDIIIEKTKETLKNTAKKPIKRIYFTYFTSYYTTILSFMTELYLVRHGQTEENAAHILQGHMPGHLSHEGIAQAQALRNELKNIRFDALLCSDLKRCMDTAMILNEPHGLPLESTPLLRERDWGPFTGMDILKARTKIDHRAEPVESMFRRAETFLLDIVSRYKDKRVLAVSHGLFCRVIQAACSGKTIRDIPRMDNAEVRRLILTPPFSFSCQREEKETGAMAN